MAAWDSRLYVFGGFDEDTGQNVNSLFEYRISSASWVDRSSPSSGSPPSPRSWPAMAVWDGELFVYGGSDAAFQALSDLHMYRISSRAWFNLTFPSNGSLPSPRQGHSMEAWGGVLYLFGGRDAGTQTQYNDLHAYSIASSSWSALLPSAGDAPSPRSFHATAMWDGVLYVFGGDNGDRFLSDLHGFAVASSSWVDLQSSSGPLPPQRSAHDMAASDGEIVLFGGSNGIGEELQDLFVYEIASNAWVDLSTPSSGSLPSPRRWHAMAAAGSVVFVFGGDAQAVANDLHSVLEPCPSASFCPNKTSALPCPPASFCPTASAEPTPCTPGYYCPGATPAPLPCTAAPGTHCPSASSSPEGVPCPAGFACAGGVWLPSECPAGSYCQTGSSFAFPCTAQPGRHCPEQSSDAAGEPCAAGFRCAGATATPQACATAGAYCPGGTSEALACSEGHYCEAGASALTPCEAPPGNHCPEQSHNASGVPCPAGFVCTGGAALAMLCGAGTYCPHGSSVEAPCAASVGAYCPAGSGEAAGEACPAGRYCTGGTATPVACEASSGWYCPPGSAGPEGEACDLHGVCAGGDATLACIAGWEPSESGASCVDESECGLTDNCDAHATCSDGGGSFTCECIEGWESSDEGVTCTDVVECGVADTCDVNAECVDGGGNFTCWCNAGWESDDLGETCVDDTECGITDDCHLNAECIDGGGSFTCTCNAGFSGSGVECVADLTCPAVRLVVSLQYSLRQFLDRREAFVRAVAAAAGAAVEAVIIHSVTASVGGRRVLHAEAVDVDVSVETDSTEAAAELAASDRLSLDSINAALKNQGLTLLLDVKSPPEIVGLSSSALAFAACDRMLFLLAMLVALLAAGM